MGKSISLVSILILLSLFFFFIYEVVTFIRIVNKKVRGKRGVHFLGAIATLLITICVCFSTFNVSCSYNLLIVVTVILASLFYIVLGWQTLFKVKDKVRKS